MKKCYSEEQIIKAIKQGGFKLQVHRSGVG